MDYRVEPTRVSQRSIAPTVIVVAVLAGFLGIAIVLANRAPVLPAGTLGILPSASVVAGAPGPSAPAAPTSRSFRLEPAGPVGTGGPGRILEPDADSCHSLARKACFEVADAAAMAVRGWLGSDQATLRIVDVSASLVCNSDADCPRELLRQLNPRGSVVVSVSGPRATAWVNVGEVPVPGVDLHAWVIRWTDATSCLSDSGTCSPDVAVADSGARMTIVNARTQLIGR